MNDADIRRLQCVAQDTDSDAVLRELCECVLPAFVGTK